LSTLQEVLPVVIFSESWPAWLGVCAGLGLRVVKVCLGSSRWRDALRQLYPGLTFELIENLLETKIVPPSDSIWCVSGSPEFVLRWQKTGEQRNYHVLGCMEQVMSQSKARKFKYMAPGSWRQVSHWRDWADALEGTSSTAGCHSTVGTCTLSRHC
jgi:hypothetical protein